MGYENVQTSGNAVSFTFDTPTTHQPRDDIPQLVSVRAPRISRSSRPTTASGSTSNDPNTVGDQAPRRSGMSFAIYAEQFFANVFANLANLSGIALSSVVRALTEGFQFALDAASEFVTNAGYTLASWVEGIGDFVSRGFDFSCVIEISNRGGPYELVLDDLRDRARDLGGPTARADPTRRRRSLLAAGPEADPRTAPKAG